MNHEYKNHSMKWMMIPCLLLLGILFLGGGKLSSSGYLLPILIGVFVVAHIWMMFRGHGEHADIDTEDNTDMATPTKESETKKDEHKHGGCCH